MSRFLVAARMAGYQWCRYRAATPADTLPITSRGAYQQPVEEHTANQLLGTSGIKGWTIRQPLTYHFIKKLRLLSLSLISYKTCLIFFCNHSAFCGLHSLLCFWFLFFSQSVFKTVYKLLSPAREGGFDTVLKRIYSFLLSQTGRLFWTFDLKRL